jgi:Overcoming lysogenization defect protein-like, TOPRIM domain
VDGVLTVATPDLTDASALVLVEGVSDKVAVETLAARRSRDLQAEGVAVVAIGGAQAIGNVLRAIGAQEREVRLAGLCDVREERDFQRALERAGLGADLTRDTMEELGFYVCDPDLEGELIRALGVAGVEAVLEQSGKLRSFRTFQKQPQWRDEPTAAQLRRFFGSSAGKIRHSHLLVEALDLDRVPRPLDRVLAHV